MEHVLILNKYDGYDIEDVYNIDDFPYDKLKKKIRKSRSGKRLAYYDDFGTFDIETTTVDKETAFMYCWQACVHGFTVFGRTHSEYITFFQRLHETMPDALLVIYVHNLSFEFQFCKDFFYRMDEDMQIFATHPRKVAKITLPNVGMEIRCSYKLTNLPLSLFTSNMGVRNPKAVDDLDYTQIRTISTALDGIEIGYCISDVVSLYEAIHAKMRTYNDDITQIPLTQTGYPRRDVKRACRANPRYHYLFFKNWQPSKQLFELFATGKRGGNTHAYRGYSGMKVKSVRGIDFVSSYPWEMLSSREYPIGQFMPYGIPRTMVELAKVIRQYACIFQIIFENVKLRPDDPIPYISKSLCLKCDNVREDNGRILSADMLMLTVTGIDWEIIAKSYTWEKVSFSTIWIARKGPLPAEIRGVVQKYFYKKCELKLMIKTRTKEGASEEELDDLNRLYMASKQHLNGIFGLLYCWPIHNEQIYNRDTHEWEIETKSIEEGLTKYYENRSNCLNIQWGIWTTALARRHLQQLIDICVDDTGRSRVIYCDTDSVKYLYDEDEAGERIEKAIQKHNEKIRQINDELGLTVEIDGKHFYLGEAENDAKYTYFKTLGAKKYCYTIGESLHVTISGVGKKEGKKAIGNIDNFRPDFIINPSGGSTLYYHEAEPHYMSYNGDTFETASSISLLPRFYQIGITDEYTELIEENLLLEEFS